MDARIMKLIGEMALNPPSINEILMTIEKTLDICFPLQYKDFMLFTNGAEGPIGSDSYLVIWSIEEIIPLNEAYAVNEFTPQLLYFGSDGGGMAYAFDLRQQHYPIVEIPFESIHIDDAKLCGNTFNEFLQNL